MRSAAAGGVSPQHAPRGRGQAQDPQRWGSAGPEHPAGAPFLVHAGTQGVQPGHARVRAGTCTHGPGHVCARARMRVQVCTCEGVGLRRALLLVDLGGGGGLPGPQCGPSVHAREARRGVGAAVNPRGELSAATRWERGLGTAQIAFGKVNCGLAFGRTCLAGHSVRAEAAGREAWGPRLLPPGKPGRGPWGLEQGEGGCEGPGGELGPLFSGASPWPPLKRAWHKPSCTAPLHRCQGQTWAGQEGASAPPQSVRQWMPGAQDICRDTETPTYVLRGDGRSLKPHPVCHGSPMGADCHPPPPASRTTDEAARI